MNTVSFYPPNYLSLSDNVIGDVIPRDQPTKRARLNCSASDASRNSSQLRLSPSSSATRPMDLPLQTEATLSRYMSQDQQIALQLVSEIKGRRREKCRINQVRYMQRQRKKINCLHEDVERLKGEVKNLEVHHATFSIEAPNHKTIWSVATAYFRLFRHGLNSPTKEANAFALKFLQTTMEPSVTDGSLNGPKALLENWRLFSLYFVDVHVELEHLKRVEGSSILVAYTSTSVKLQLAHCEKCSPTSTAMDTVAPWVGSGHFLLVDCETNGLSCVALCTFTGTKRREECREWKRRWTCSRRYCVCLGV